MYWLTVADYEFVPIHTDNVKANWDEKIYTSGRQNPALLNQRHRIFLPSSDHKIHENTL